MDISSFMQLRCGQCGKHLVLPMPEATVQYARCDDCGHEIWIESFVNPELVAMPAPVEFVTDGVDFSELARKALRERVMVSCVHCNGKLKVSKRMVGQQVNCVLCGQEFKIPDLYEEDEFDRYLEPTAAARAQLSGNVSAAGNADRKVNMNRAQQRKQLITMGIAAAAALAIAITALIYFGGESENATPADSQNLANGQGWPLKPPKNPANPNKISPPDNSGNPKGNQTADNTQNPRPPKNDEQGQKPVNPPAKDFRLSVIPQQARWAKSIAGCSALPKPGNLFLIVNLKIRALKNVPELANFHKSLRIKLADETYYSIGSPPQNSASSLLPVPLMQQKISIAQNTTKDLTCVFELPARQAEGQLIAQSAKPVSVRIPLRAAKLNSLAGTYKEILPRRLVPVMENPIRYALQCAPGASLTISTQQKNIDSESPQYDIEIPQANIKGQLIETDPGVFDATLKLGTYVLNCKFYGLPDTKQCILYLSSKPGYQLIYKIDKANELSFDTIEPYTEPFNLAR